ncbi:MAG: enoyl-CoA hydratase/isomerase family protein [Acetobacteraceae bacterium]|nr:enoyl-CoA hydratase/isomerase family protein [Acetobacteraceae bacterium]
MTTEDSLITGRDGRAGRILMNRPKSLNAIDLPMIRAMTKILLQWRDDPAVQVVIVEGAGDRAFCAGGDIVALREDAMAGRTDAVESFFSEEYELNKLIAAYPKPYVSLIDGVCMGGGIGVSVYGPYRVASEHAMFAMPETIIGFFPDIGGTFFLPRLPGELGSYLGLTGARVRGADSVRAGFATHYLPRAHMGELSLALVADGVGALGGFAKTLPDGTLAGERAAIDRCFAGDSVPEIVARLRAEGSDWAAGALKLLGGVSPSACVWTLRALRIGAGLDLAACLAMELRMTQVITKHPDFIEGVRATLVDRDHNPKWTPDSLDHIDPAVIDRVFA